MREPQRLWSRRAALGPLLGGLILPDLARGHETAPVHLTCRAGRLSWPTGSTRAAIGKGGARVLKREGDLATPIGDFALLRGFFRADRVKLPATAMPMSALTPSDAWVDDVKDAEYNRFVRLPYRAHVEQLWRQDDIYDVLIVVGYNLFPTIAGAGSAIFLHIARKTFSPTVGCVAIEREALLRLLPLLGPESRLRIEA